MISLAVTHSHFSKIVILIYDTFDNKFITKNSFYRVFEVELLAVF